MPDVAQKIGVDLNPPHHDGACVTCRFCVDRYSRLAKCGFFGNDLCVSVRNEIMRAKGQPVCPHWQGRPPRRPLWKVIKGWFV